MIIVKDQKIDAVHDTIRHGFFGKMGGVSQGVYESLNCGSGSNDNPDDVQRNKDIVAQHFGMTSGCLHSAWQVHSADCIVLENTTADETRKIKADGLVTDKVGVMLGTLTADCTPILFSGLKADGAPVIGAAHSGWGGSLKGIGEATINKMLELGARLETIQAAIGPCIGPKSMKFQSALKNRFWRARPRISISSAKPSVTGI